MRARFLTLRGFPSETKQKHTPSKSILFGIGKAMLTVQKLRFWIGGIIWTKTT
jgi:hypothetical protein